MPGGVASGGVYRQVRAVSATVAHVIRGALEAEGFDVRLERDALGAVYGLDSGRFQTRVLVPEGQLQRAQELLTRIESGEA